METKKGRIHVIGMGSSCFDDLKKHTRETILNSTHIYARTEKHTVVEELRSKGILVNSFDNIYDLAEEVSLVDVKIVETLREFTHDEDIIYLVPGSPFVLEKSVELLIDEFDDLLITSAESSVDIVLGSLRHVSEGYKVISGKDFKISSIDFQNDIFIQEIDDEYLLDEIITKLSEVYSENSKFSLIKDASLDSEEIKNYTFGTYKREITPNHQTTIFIYKPNENIYDFTDLLNTVDTLRGPDGCPWDIEQTHDSMKHDLLEETYELVDAIDRDNVDDMIDEVGDILLQVVMHAQIGYEEDGFSIFDVTTGINNKLISRHPHVFGNLRVDNKDILMLNWDSVKDKEKSLKSFVDRLDSLKGLPSTIRAYKLIDKVTRIGFDWDNREQALHKVKEEYHEVVEALDDPKALREELGDLFFTVCNLSHYLGYEPEILLTEACNKFVDRFRMMEEIAISKGVELTNMGNYSLEEFWQEAKHK